MGTVTVTSTATMPAKLRPATSLPSPSIPLRDAPRSVVVAAHWLTKAQARVLRQCRWEVPSPSLALLVAPRSPSDPK
jgi:hypothetical protein